MRFFVNEINDYKLTKSLEYGKHLIGLFRECKVDGRGTFCGYYASEYYLDTELYAYYIAEYVSVYTPEARIGELVVPTEPIKYAEVEIGSDMWTNIIDASDIKDAIECFVNAKWSRG